MMKRFLLNTLIEIKESAILYFPLHFHTASATDLPKHPTFPYKYFEFPNECLHSPLSKTQIYLADTRI